MYAILGFRVDDRYRDSLEQAQRHEALLLISEAIIFVCEGEAIEYWSSIHEVETVHLQVALALRLVPSDPHGLLYWHYVYTSIAMFLPHNVSSSDLT